MMKITTQTERKLLQFIHLMIQKAAKRIIFSFLCYSWKIFNVKNDNCVRGAGIAKFFNYNRSYLCIFIFLFVNFKNFHSTNYSE